MIDVLLRLLKWRYPTPNDFGFEIIPAVEGKQCPCKRNCTKHISFQMFDLEEVLSYIYKELITPLMR